MARRNTASIPNPYQGYEDVLPNESQAADDKIQQYQQQLNRAGGFSAAHPKIAAGLGFLLAGPSGAFMFPAAGRQQQALVNRQVSQDYDAWRKSLGDIGAQAEPLYQALDAQAKLDEARRQGLIDPNTPDIVQRSLPSLNTATGEVGEAPQQRIPRLSREYLENTLQGSFAGSDIDYQRRVNQATAYDNYRLPSALNAAVGASQQPESLQAGVREFSPEVTPVKAPFYVANPGKIMEGVTSTGNAALGQGQQRYEFDAQAPQRDAALQKDLAQAELLRQQGKTQQFETKIREIESKYRGSLLQSEINRNNRPPAGGSGPSVEQQAYASMSPEQRAAFIQRKAYGDPGSNLPAYNAATGLRSQIFNKDKNGYTIAPEILDSTLQQYNDLVGQNNLGLPRLQRPSSGPFAQQGGQAAQRGSGRAQRSLQSGARSITTPSGLKVKI